MAEAPPPDPAAAAAASGLASDPGGIRIPLAAESPRAPASLQAPAPPSPTLPSVQGVPAAAGGVSGVSALDPSPSPPPPEPTPADRSTAESSEQQSSSLPPAEPPLAPPPQPPAAQPPPPQLPVVDLIGLRFSLQHLRLVGYGLLAVWASEIVNLLTSPKLAEIGTRLHNTSQFLDLSPILLVAIGLIAFQGGLRRRAVEVALLPLLLALLPLLCALHFFLAPVSVANVVTLVQKQQQISLDQLEKIDQQIDRASTILRESDSIDTLLEGLQRIPGLQVRVPAKASVTEARQEVRRSLERERDRVRERIEANLSASREAFIRRAATNAALALVVGLLLWGLHHGAMREMEQAIPFLDWVLVHGEQQQPEPLQELLRFQRACVALGWFSLLERSLRLVRRVVRRPTAAQLEEEERQRQAQAAVPANPFVQRAGRNPGGLHFGGLRSAPLPLFSGVRPSMLAIGSLDVLPPGADPQAHPGADPQGGLSVDPHPDLPADALASLLRRSNASAERREQRRRQRDLERYRAHRRQIEREGRDPFALFSGEDPQPEARLEAAPPRDPAADLQLQSRPPLRGLASFWAWLHRRF